MARKFKTSDIIDPVKAPITKRSLEHLNTSFDDLGDDTVKALIGTYTANDVLILHGCDVVVATGSIPGTGTATLSAGAVYYNGRIYKVDANGALATTNPQTLIWEIVETTVAGDPATFSDGVTYDFHIIEKFRLVAGTVGAGLANYNAATVKLGVTRKKIQVGDWNMDANTSVTIPHGLGDNWKKIQIVKGWIRNDADTLNYNLYFRSSAAAIDLAYTYDATNVYLFRIAGGDFDGVDFDSTSYNRGFIYIEYGDV